MTERRTVYDPPTEVVVVGYVWADGNASGGRTEAFLSMGAAERRLAQILAEGKIKDGKVAVWLLGVDGWEPVVVHLPEPLRLASEAPT